MKAACASETCPVLRMMFSPSAITALINAMSNMCSQKFPGRNVGTRKAATTASTTKIAITRLRGTDISSFPALEKAIRLPQQDAHDHQEAKHVGRKRAEQCR